DLGAVAGLPGDRLDLDGAVLDLGDLGQEQLPNELRRGARQDDADAVAVFANLEDDGLDALAGVVRLPGDLFAARQQGLGLAERDDGGAALEALDGAEHEVALLGEVLVEDGVALLLADALDDELLGGAGGDAAEFLRRQHRIALARDDLPRLAVD